MNSVNATKRKRVNAIFKKYAPKKAKISVPMRFFENKTRIYGTTTVVTTTTGSIVNLENIAGGSGRDERQGNKVTFNSMDIRLKFTANTLSAAAVGQLCRVLIVVDTQQQSLATPTVSQILESDILSGLGLDRKGRFKILFDKTALPILADQSAIYFEKTVKFNLTTEWNTSTATAISKNGIYMLLISDAASNAPSISYNIRTNFTDW